MITTVTTFLGANMGHLLTLLAAIVLTLLALSPIIAFLRRGWASKREDIFSSFSPAAKATYVKTFRKDIVPVAAKAGSPPPDSFDESYNDRYGRKYFILPTILFVIVTLAAMFVFSETALLQILLVSGDKTLSFGKMSAGAFSYLQIPFVAAAGISGAYLWIVSDLALKASQLNLKPVNVLNAALRLSMSAAIAYAISAIAKDSVSAPLAFAVGAFPLDSIRLMLRNFTTKTLNLGGGVDETAKDPTTKLNGVDPTAADRLLDADISNITQLAYCDPVQLCMRTGYLFSFIVDIASQALAWNYLEAKLVTLRPMGLRGAMEISDLMECLRRTPQDDDVTRAATLMDQAATAVGMTPAQLYNAFDEIAGDPYTEFLSQVWRE